MLSFATLMSGTGTGGGHATLDLLGGGTVPNVSVTLYSQWLVQDPINNFLGLGFVLSDARELKL